MGMANQKISDRQIILWLSILLFCIGVAAMTTIASAGEIYKSYDENGNVVYSDQPPEPDAEPLILPEPNIVTSTPAAPSSSLNQGFDNDNASPLVLKMLTPVADETFWGSGQSLEVSFEVQPEMLPGMRIAIYIDDQRQALVNTPSATISSIERGTHSVRAELLDNRGNVLTNTEPRTFFMKQYSTNFNN